MPYARKKIYIAVLFNFFIGIVVGIVLFYAQLRGANNPAEGELTYDATIGVADFFRIWWLNLLWIFSFFIAHNMLPSPYIYPLVVVRGCSNSFSAMYMMHFIGIKEATVSVLPQCFSILLLLLFCSVALVEKRHKSNLPSSVMLSPTRAETLFVFLITALCAAVEIFFFRILYAILF